MRPPRARPRTPRVCLALGVLLLASAGGVPAQYFGRNKVQWERFRFQVLRTDHFELHYYPEEEEAVRDAAIMAERWYGRLSTLLAHDMLERKPILLYSDHPDFQQTNATGGLIGQGTGGFTEPLQDRVVMPLTGDLAETDHVLGHELVHAFQFDILESAPRGGRLNLSNLPLWVVEGMAEYLSVGRVDPHTAMWLRDAVIHDRIPTVRQLSTDPRFFPYRFGQAFWAYVTGRWGDHVVRPFFAATAAAGPEAAIRAVLSVDPETFSKEWAEAIRSHYGPLLEGRQRRDALGTPLLSRERGAGSTNLAPSLSPDGRTIAFLSTRDVFNIEVFLADTTTGRVLGRLFKSEADPHIDALRFIDSAGSWSPDGRRLVYAVFARGDNELAIVDAQRGEIERRIRVEGVSALMHPAWSPDGRTIAVSGMQGGISDLWLVDIESGVSRRLTKDRWSDLHPAWSPDGRTIAFTSDRSTGADLEQLRPGSHRLALIPSDGGDLRVVDTPEGAKAINPAFSPDGTSIYFISDREGFSDVYRVDLGSGTLFQVTRVATGVSGITELAPALSVGRSDGTLAFSMFVDGDSEIFLLPADRAQGVPLEPSPAVSTAGGTLPPAEAARTSAVETALRRFDGPEPRTSEAPYDPSLRLLAVVPPVVGVSTGRFGTELGGAATAIFSDLLGNHTLGVTFQATGTLEDFGGEVFYQNLKRRWNWGAALSRIPYLAAGTTLTATTAVIDGEEVPATLVEQFIERTTLTRATMLVEYPFSTRRRLELSADATRYGFDLEVDQFLVVDGTIVDEGTQGLPAPEGFTLYGGSVAFVGDSSDFGYTSPLRGARWRFEGGATSGELSFATALADWRRYVFRRPVTLAMRALHFGRYGSEAESPRISPLYLGSPSLVRGYEVGSFRPEDCSIVPEDPTACPEFDRLLGSRVALLGAELRVPLLGSEEFGLFEAPYLPTELSAFFDAGVAWTDDDSPELRWSRDSLERVPVTSAGVSARFLLGGFLVIEAYYAYPFQRPDAGAVFGLHFAPGW